MSDLQALRSFLTALIATCAIASGAYGQPAPKRQSEGRVTMTECEGVDNCTTWIFRNTKGVGKWRTGEEAILEVESVKDDRIVIHRTDVTGSKEGLTATYTGTLRGDRVGGEYSAIYQGVSQSGFWYAIIGDSAAGPPGVLHWCAQHCSTWTLDKGAPFDKPHYGSEALGSLVIVERFTRESVVMLRTDYRPYPGTAILRGQLSSDGNSIVNGTMEWTYHPCCGLTRGPFYAAWGPAIDTVPGSDAERAARGSQPQQQQISAKDVLETAKDVRDWIQVFQFFSALLQ